MPVPEVYISMIYDGSRPVRNAYLVIWKMGITRTYVNENEQQPGGFARRILKE